MRLGKIAHFLKHQISCSDEEWDKRQAVISILTNNGYAVEEVPNPSRLNAYKGGEEFIIDILGDSVHILPVEWVGRTNKPILVTDIPSSGRYGIRNDDSKYYEEIYNLIGGKDELQRH